MARVVQRRKSPPYALIVFVFLFLIASTLLVLQYTEADELRKNLDQRNAVLAKLASKAERQGPKIQGMMREYDRTKNTVISQHEKHINDLTQLITGTPREPTDTIAKADRLFKQINSRQGLIQEVLDAHNKLANAIEQVKQLQRNRKQHAAELATRDQSAKKMQTAFDVEVSRQNQRIEEIKRQGQQREKAHRDLLEGAKKEWSQIREGLTRKIAGLVQDVEKGRKGIKKWQTDYKSLEEKFEQYRPKFVPNVARKADGRVIKLVEEAGLCYIDLGLKDRIVPGLTFSVYPKTGIPQDGIGKAKIVVTNISETVSECRVTYMDRKHPMLMGDLIANLVYDPVRKYRFVVEGEFDLHGKNNPTRDGTKEVRLLIHQFGGVLAKEVGVDSDFVIMGEPPKRPAKPDENAPPQVGAVYKDLMKIYDHYFAVQRLAQSLRIPLLNTNRFIAFMGYVPVEKLQ